MMTHATVMPIKPCDRQHAYQLERELLREKRGNNQERSRERKNIIRGASSHHRSHLHKYASTHSNAKLGHDVTGEGHYSKDVQKAPWLHMFISSGNWRADTGLYKSMSFRIVCQMCLKVLKIYVFNEKKNSLYIY